MAVELVLWASILIIAGVCYFASQYFGSSHLFFISCALLVGSGALLYGFDGLVVDRLLASVDEFGVYTYTDVVVPISNVGLSMLALGLVSVGVLGVFVAAMSGASRTERSNPFHY